LYTFLPGSPTSIDVFAVLAVLLLISLLVFSPYGTGVDSVGFSGKEKNGSSLCNASPGFL
jgi:hypothetical protein